MVRRDRNSFAVSVGAHGLAIALLIAWVRTHPEPRYAAPSLPLDLEIVGVTPPAASELARVESPQPRAEPETVHEPVARAASASAFAHRSSMESPPSAPEAPIAATPAQPQAPPEGPFTTWLPRDHVDDGSRTAPVVASADVDADRAAMHGALRDSVGNDIVHAGSPQGRAEEQSVGYIRRMMDDAYPTQIPGSMPYWSRVRRTASQLWRPAPVPVPDLLHTALNTFFAPVSVSQDATRRSLGPLAEGRSAAMADALDAAHPNSPSLQPRNTMAARAEATARTYHTEIEVDQDSTGRIVAVRISRASGITGFDDAAIQAIHDAVAQLDSPPMPGGWRSRWDMAIVVSRDPLISALPSTDGAPAFGLTAEMSTDADFGDPTAHLPGRVHRRRAIHLISSHVIQPATAPRTPSNAH